MHIIPQQVFNAALVGLVLGLIAVRGKSLWPCIVFHFIYNAMAVLHGHLGHMGRENPDLLDKEPISSGKGGKNHSNRAESSRDSGCSIKGSTIAAPRIFQFGIRNRSVRATLEVSIIPINSAGVAINANC